MSDFNGTVRVGGFELHIKDGHGLLPKGTVLSKAGAPRKGLRSSGRNIHVKEIRNAGAYGPGAVAGRVVEALGNNVAAGLLGVAQDRPGRWVKGTDRPSEENRAKLADLDSLVGQLLAVFTPAQAALWLEGQDPFLQARPIDVFRFEGPARLIEAMKAYEQGAFA
ncbi:hypothetical protein [Arthrobacter sp. CAN_A214]|uniref:hypothetical protein n=1 Tax=Arthrobacter sp. CAN_A214 TaxID=2787720 RepID=UPI0018CAA8FC